MSIMTAFQVAIVIISILLPFTPSAAIHITVLPKSCKWLVGGPINNPWCGNQTPNKCTTGNCNRNFECHWLGCAFITYWYCLCPGEMASLLAYTPSSTPCKCHDEESCSLLAAQGEPAQRQCIYYYVDIDLPYNDAPDYCMNMFGSSLATIDANFKRDYATHIIADDTAVWTGLHNTDKVGWFEWEDGICSNAYGSCVGEEYWESGRPRCVIDEQGNTEFQIEYQGDGYSFVTINGDGKLDNNKPGDEPRPFLCNSGFENLELEVFEDSTN